MKGAVYYHSRWGNCKEIAEAIAQGLSDSGHEVELASIEQEVSPPEDLDFVVIGSPTRGGKASRPARRFIRRNIGKGFAGKRFAAFGTGFVSARDEEQPQSADQIYMALSAEGLKPLANPFKAGVEGLKGPLAQGELIRAVKYGVDIGEVLSWDR